MKTWVVTGGTGFIGSHVARMLSAKLPGHPRIAVLVRNLPSQGSKQQGLAYYSCDLEARHATQHLIETLAPDVVIHCAGKVEPEQFHANVVGTSNLLEALAALHKPVRFVNVGSAAELGPVPLESLPVTEEYPLSPTTQYGHAKRLIALRCLECEPPLEPIHARVFNPIGPGMGAAQAFGRFARELANAKDEPIVLRVGDLDPRRDFVDVRDVARAIIEVALNGEPRRVYNIGTGKSISIGMGLEYLIELSGKRVEIEFAAELSANRGPMDSRACLHRIETEIGWLPLISWQTSLEDLWHDLTGQSEESS